MRDRNLRLIGGLFLLLAAIAWYEDFDPFPLRFWGLQALFPPYLLLGFVGLIVVIAPALPLHLIAAALRGPLGERLIANYEKANAESRVAPPGGDQAGPVDVVRWVQTENRRRDTRYYLTVLAIILFAAVALPLLVIRLIERREFGSTGIELSRLVQNQSISFSSADAFRRVLEEGEQSVRVYGQRRTATLSMYNVLHKLYAPDVTSDSVFNDRAALAYAENIQSHSVANSPFLDDSVLKLKCRRSVEPAFACQSYLTLLASLSALEGRDGQFVGPYLKVRQLTSAALELRGSTGAIPATHNLRGVAFANLMTLHADYSKGVEEAETLRKSGKPVLYFDEQSPLGELTLARKAFESFSIAMQDTTSHFNLARSLNNSVDLSRLLLKAAHVEKHQLAAVDQLELRFRTKMTGLTPDGRVDPPALSRALDSIDASLKKAASLSRAPQIYFTRAQMFSLAGDLASRGLLRGTKWEDTAWVRLTAIANLSTARTLGLPDELLSPARDTLLGLTWLWASPMTGPLMHSILTRPLAEPATIRDPR